MRVAICSWEIGRVKSGFGTKIGGLGSVVEELPAELVRAARREGLELEIELLSPCFAHYDRSRLTKLPLSPQVVIEGHAFPFEIYEHVFTDTVEDAEGAQQPVKIRSLYFWDLWQLSWTGAHAIYASDPWVAIKLFSSVGQAMAAYIRQGNFDTVHLHEIGRAHV
jgi:hypothetical protein